MLKSQRISELPQFTGSIIGNELIATQNGLATRKVSLGEIYHSASLSATGSILSASFSQRITNITASYANTANYIPVRGSESEILVSAIDLDTNNLNVTSSHKTGRITWNIPDYTAEVHTDVNEVRIQLGQETVVRVRNNTGATIPNGKAVYISGALGSSALISLADGDSSASVDRTIGVTTHDIEDNTFGYVTTFGLVRDLNTNGLPDGTKLYLGTSGSFVSTTSSLYNIQLGYVIREHINQGVILVNVDKRGSQLNAQLENALTTGSLLTLIGAVNNSSSFLPLSSSLSTRTTNLETGKANFSDLYVTGSGAPNIISAKIVVGSVAGNNRGTGSVDLQQVRSSASQVASGYCSTIGGGSNNTASGAYSVVVGGFQGKATGARSFVGNGGGNEYNGTDGNTASGYGSVVVGGGDYQSRNVASGNFSFVGGGRSNTASGFFSSIIGGSNNIASNYHSTVGGGGNNTASNYYSAVGGGSNNDASNFFSTVGGGNSNTASGYRSIVGGGSNNTASNYYSTVGGGNSNTASGYGSTIAGGVRALADRLGMEAYSAGAFTSDGDSQRASFVLRNTTSNNTPTTLFLNGASIRLTIPNNKIVSFVANITGVRVGGADVSMYIRQGVIKNVGGTTSLVGTVNTVGVDIESNASTDVAITADDTNDALQINVTGISSQNWRWVAHVQAVEIGF